MRQTSAAVWIAAAMCFGMLVGAPSQASPLSTAGALGGDATRATLNDTAAGTDVTPVRYHGRRYSRHYGWYRGRHYGWRHRYGWRPRYYAPRYGYYGPRYRYYGFGYGPGVRFYW